MNQRMYVLQVTSPYVDAILKPDSNSSIYIYNQSIYLFVYRVYAKQHWKIQGFEKTVIEMMIIHKSNKF